MLRLFTIFLFILLSTFITACDRSSETEEEAPLRMVRTFWVANGDMDNWYEFPGVVEAAREADLSFRVSGQLKKLSAREGDRVEKDQLLAQLDATDYDIQLNSRQAEYNKADADFKRAEKLVNTGAISRADHERLKSQWETSAAALAAAQQNVAYTSLKAPFSGRIATRHVENFEEVSAKQTIYTLQDPSAITIRIDVPESIMIRARENTRPEAYAVFAQIPQRKFSLILKEVSTKADVQTSTYAVTFDMPLVDELNILPGMSVTVYGRPDNSNRVDEGVISVPAHTVLEDINGRFVFVVKREADGKGTIEKRAVTIGELTDSGLTVTSGLRIGDEVVSAGMSKMTDGLKVRLPAEAAQ